MDKNKDKRINMYLDEIDKDINSFISCFLRIMSYKNKIKKIDTKDIYKNELGLKIQKLNKKIKILEKYKGELALNLSDIKYGLRQIDKELREQGEYLHLEIVGGASLLFNGIPEATIDIDTITPIKGNVREIIYNSDLDINDDAIDYIDNYDGLEFIEFDEEQYSNIVITYLSTHGALYAKLKHVDPDKLDALAESFERIGVKITRNSIKQYFEDYGLEVDERDIDRFLESQGLEE